MGATTRRSRRTNMMDYASQHFRKIFYFFFVFNLGACTLVGRHPTSGYAKRYPDSISGESFRGGSLQDQVLRRERSLTQRRELEQYSKVLPLFKNLEERLEFLSLPDLEARNTWLQQVKIFDRQKNLGQEFNEVVESKDIALGMPERLVKQSWGEPDQVEVSGHPLFKNQRWKYISNVPTVEGFITEKKTVYFEAGKVIGWDSDN